MTATITSTFASFPDYRMPLSSSMNRRRDAMTLFSQQQSQEDVTRDMKASIKLMPAPLLSRDTTHDYELQRDEECSTDQAENRDGEDDSDERATEPFRAERVWLDEDDERNSLWTLKRANPVFDDSDEFDELDDDEAQYYESPSKRSRVQHLSLSDRVDENARNFDWEEAISRAP